MSDSPVTDHVQKLEETLDVLVGKAREAADAIPEALLPRGMAQCAEESEIQTRGPRAWARDVEILQTLRALHSIPFTELSTNGEPRGTVLEALVRESRQHPTKLRDGSALNGDYGSIEQTFPLFCVISQIARTTLGLAEEQPATNSDYPRVRLTEKGQQLLARLLS